MLTDFQNSFTDELTGKFAIKSLLNIPLHLKHIATLLCEISAFKKIAIAQGLSAPNSGVRLTHSKSHGKVFVSLTFVDSEVKSSLHSNITRVKQFLSVIGKLYDYSFFIPLSRTLQGMHEPSNLFACNVDKCSPIFFTIQNSNNNLVKW